MAKKTEKRTEKEEPDEYDLTGSIKKYILLFIIVTIAIVLAYIIRFISTGWSSDPADWGVFGDYLGGVLNPIISFITLLVTVRIAILLHKIEKANHKEGVHSQVKPVFIIEGRDFYSADISAIGPTVMDDYYSYKVPEAPARFWDQLRQPPFYIRLANVGLGIATRTEASWEINLQRCKDVIEFDHDNVKVSLNTYGDDWHWMEYNLPGKESGRARFLSKDRTWIGIVSHQNQHTEVEVPDHIITAFKLFNLRRRATSDGLIFPEIDLVFTFRNIYSQILTVKFKIWLRPIHDYDELSLYRISASEQEPFQ